MGYVPHKNATIKKRTDSWLQKVLKPNRAMLAYVKTVYFVLTGFMYGTLGWKHARQL